MKKGEEETGYIKWFSELSNKDIAIAGGKGASLCEMYNAKFPIPPGFIVTAQAYHAFLESSGLVNEIKDILSKFKIEDTQKLEDASKRIRAMIENASFSPEMEKEILEAYDILDANKPVEGMHAGAAKILKNSYEPPFVAVRSSATAEDLVDASFAGQQDSFLNVKGHKDLLLKIKACFSSLFTARAIYYRTNKGFDHTKTYLAAVIQKMINSDKSGVMFSKNPISIEDNIVIEAVWGLGEGIVSGTVKPDHYVISPNMEEFKVLDEKISEKKVAFTRDASGENKVVKLTSDRAKQKVLGTYELKILAGYAKKLEEHYGRPQDIEFAISGQDIYIVQSRPITTKASTLKGKEMTGTVLLSGLGASPGISSGVVKIVRNLNDLTKVQKGDVMVAEMTNPDMVVSMQKASGIVTDEGGVTSHAAIVSREMGIPAVVGTGEATKKLVDGQEVTVDGFTGKVYEGKGETKIVEVLPIVPTKTHIKVIVDLPNFADRAAKSGAKAVGLVRLEGIIAESGKHPVMFEKTNKIGDYMSIIYKGLKEIAKPFQEVWVRSSDIRSDEYMHLEGAPEKPEMNPMLGDHGIRFSLRHKPIFEAEMKAIKQLALENKGKKFGIMVPQVICLDDLKQTKAMAKSLNMPENVKIGIMVETPAAVQIIQDLCEEGMDFISFGTNDLTQYTLAIDRGNEYVQYLYDELNPAVLNSIRYVIRKCRKYGVETSICGQSASKEEMVRFLIGEGIDSLSVNADAAQKVSMLVAELEKKSVVQSGNVNVPPNPGKMNSPNNQNKSNKSNKNDNPVQGKKPEVDELDNAGKKEDIEEIILNELSKDEYSPSGARDSRQEIPLLNDSIPVGSDLFENKKEEKEFDLTRELG